MIGFARAFMSGAAGHGRLHTAGHWRLDRGAVIIDVPLTYAMLARCLGTTTRSVDRTFATWLAEGWLERTGGRCRILDLAPLEAHADPARIALFHRLR